MPDGAEIARVIRGGVGGVVAGLASNGAAAGRASIVVADARAAAGTFSEVLAGAEPGTATAW